MTELSRDAARQIARIAKAFCKSTSCTPQTRFFYARFIYKCLRTNNKVYMQNRAACQASIVPDQTLLDIAKGYTMTGSRAISTLMNNAII